MSLLLPARLVWGSVLLPQTLPHVPATCRDFIACLRRRAWSFVHPHSPAASSWSGTSWSASSWSGTSWGASSWSGTSWGGTSWGATATLVAATRLAATNFAAANFRATNLGAMKLWHLEAAGLFAAAVATCVAAGRRWCTAGRHWCTAGRSASCWGGTARCWSGARRWSATTTTLIAVVVEQASVGTVDAGKTNQRGGHPYEFHLSLSFKSGPWNVRDYRVPSGHIVRWSRHILGRRCASLP